ncbi:molybdenum ABC transporter ATP-binding protein [Zoogloea sp.]|uniref:molybdenum ABC transporter ATP-binding protein n=1 Tax=Zoogloea sp. TaxID=49181 RepID=UPI002620C2AF|nr:molybdenum ABC transporter ATP-binding protein [Zoogloea sp.]MDD3352304.1 molybdenum ABC transporter ATP-binding protein [Zoogloea sp.]
MSVLRLALDLPLTDFNLHADLTLPGRGVTALFGPSGSGKTTLLRCVAGLARGQGRVEVNGECWQDDARRVFLPVHRRPLGYVFQEPSLFPHLSVRANLEFGLRRIPPAERRVGWDVAMSLLGIGHLLERGPERLSGGERQRVAIARALLTSPRLLLMDEPLAALDAARKQEILPYLEGLHRELEIPVLYVSHSREEVARLADHLVLLDRGLVTASGAVAEILARTDLSLTRDEDAGVLLETRVEAHDEIHHLTRLAFSGGCLWVNHQQRAPGEMLLVRIPARDVSLALEGGGPSSILNRLAGTVSGFAEAAHPAHCLVTLDVGGCLLLARITRKSRDQLGLIPGMAVVVQVKAVALLA